jgi:predicted dehydrogenase
MLAFLKEGAETYDAQQERSGSGGTPINPEPINTYRAEIEEFSQAILDGREPTNNAQLGLQSQRVLAACYQSAQTGRFVDVS